MDVSGLRCLVTGTASGIGDEVVRQLTAGGASVVSLDRNEPTAEVTQHVSVDLASTRSIDEALDTIEGSFDVLVNVAGIPGTWPADMVFKVNFLGLRHLTESLLDRMNPGGSIVHVSSTASRHWRNRLELIKSLLATETFDEGAEWFAANAPAMPPYDFSKEAVTVYTMAMGNAVREMGNLRMNAVLPGAVETPILVDFEESMGKELLDGAKAFLGRHAEPSDIAPAVVFLASRESGWINGTCLPADGGLTGATSTGLVPDPDPETVSA